jgi:hypothetical protein
MISMNRTVKAKNIDRFFVAAFFSLTLFFFGPAQIIFTNINEFHFSVAGILCFLIGLALVGMQSGMLLLTIMPKTISDKILTFLLAVAVLLWLQGNILVWDYGLMDGHDILWGEKTFLGLIDTTVWILLLALIAAQVLTLLIIAVPKGWNTTAAITSVRPPGC